MTPTGEPDGSRDPSAARSDGSDGSGAIRFGIVGAGKVAEVHASALGRIAEAALVGIAGRSTDRANALAARHGATAYPSLDAMLEAASLDALVVATPHPLHATQATAAAAAGVHVVVEKPLALSVADADRVIEAAEASGVVVSVIAQRRWYPAVRRVRAAIDDGRIGEPAVGTIEVLGWRGPEYYAMDDWRGTVTGEGGGVLVNQAVHQLDLLRWFLGPIVEVDGLTANLNHAWIEVEDSAVAIVRFVSGAIATIVASNSQRPGLWGRVHVHGRNGASVGVETDAGSSFVAGISTPSIGRNDLWTIPGEEGLPARWAEEDATALAGVDVATHFHELQLRDVVESIRTGRRPAVDAEDGRATVELMAAIYEAARSGGRVELEAPRRRPERNATGPAAARVRS